MADDTLPFLQAVTDVFSRTEPDRCIIGIVGPPASGKSTVTDRLVEQLNQWRDGVATQLRMDAYHRTNQELHDRGTFLWKGCHFTFDGHAYLAKLREVKESETAVLCPIYDRSKGVDAIPNAHTILPEHRIVVTEGNYLLADIDPWRDIRPLLDYVVFIEVDDAVQKARLLDRHQLAGRTEQEAIAKVNSTDLPNSVFIRQSLAGVDFTYRPDANFTP